MRTTLDLPDDLFRKLKVRAAAEGKTLKVLLNEIVERAVSSTGGTTEWKRPRDFSGTIRGETGPAMKAMNNEKVAELLDQE